jgi:hypothetical protein
MNETTKEFVQAHSINVLDDRKRAHKLTRMNTKFFECSNDYNLLNDYFTEQRMETETLYTVEISESELQKIAEFESQVFNNMRQQGHYNMFEVLMEQKEQEKYLKNKYTAVRKAYEQYSLMLKLAQSGEL